MAVSEKFAQLISASLISLGISQREAAKRSGISPGYISNMCLGQVPGMAKLLQFASGLQIDPQPLLAAAGYTELNSFTPGRGDENAIKVPVIGAAPGGNWRLAAAHADNYHEVPPGLADNTDYSLTMVGDSMWPYLMPGDVIGIREQSHAASGQIVIARLGEEVTVKKWQIENNEYWLVPFNPIYKPINVKQNTPDFAIIG
ncbi:MAG: LexA family transcriptional regulator, partial [bacterium]